MFKVNNKDTRNADLEWLFRSHPLLILTVSSLSKKNLYFYFHTSLWYLKRFHEGAYLTNKNWFLWSNSYNIEVMITSFIEMLVSKPWPNDHTYNII